MPRRIVSLFLVLVLLVSVLPVRAQADFWSDLDNFLLQTSPAYNVVRDFWDVFTFTSPIDENGNRTGRGGFGSGGSGGGTRGGETYEEYRDKVNKMVFDVPIYTEHGIQAGIVGVRNGYYVFRVPLKYIQPYTPIVDKYMQITPLYEYQIDYVNEELTNCLFDTRVTTGRDYLNILMTRRVSVLSGGYVNTAYNYYYGYLITGRVRRMSLGSFAFDTAVDEVNGGNIALDRFPNNSFGNDLNWRNVTNTNLSYKMYPLFVDSVSSYSGVIARYIDLYYDLQDNDLNIILLEMEQSNGDGLGDVPLDIVYFDENENEYKVRQGDTIINFGDNTIVNLADGSVYQFNDCWFDYSTRTYHITDNSGQQHIVNYGDEYISYTYNNQAYNYYYITDGSGGNGGGESGGDGLAGIMGGVGKSLANIADGLAAFFGALLSPLAALSQAVVSGIASFVGIVSALFTAIPALFLGFGEFLAATFAFVPGEFVQVMTFGLVLAVAAGVLKLFLG